MHFEYSSLVADYDLRGFKINVTMAEKSAPKPQSSYSHGYNSWSCTYCCYHCYDEKLFLLNINRLLNIIVIPLEKNWVHILQKDWKYLFYHYQTSTDILLKLTISNVLRGTRGSSQYLL